jgi:prepilin-type N-terminal cleavage/methylation domain-containing protein
MRTIKGFSLIEMVIVLAITAVVVTLAAVIYRAGFTNYTTAVNATKLSTQATLAMDRLSKELKKAISFTAMNNTNVSFATVDGSSLSYSWTSPTLTRTGSSAQTVNNKVTDFSLSYYQANFNTAITLTSVQAITITMTLSNGSERVPLINTVYLNNKN